MSSTVRICLRDDDVCWHTPVPVLDRLREEVWRDRPLTNAVIPRVGSSVFSRRIPFGSEGVRERDVRGNREVMDHLHREVGKGWSDVAVHGVTHLAHQRSDGLQPERGDGLQPVTGGLKPALRPLAEFEIADPTLIARLIAECRALRAELGTSFFVPPHNDAHPDVVAACLAAGFDVCRSMTADEVREVTGGDSRDEAKRLQPYRWSGAGLEIFQTILLSKERIAKHGSTPAEIARRVAGIARHTGIAVITLHWWDFTTDDAAAWDPAYARWMQDFLAAVESQLIAAQRTPVYSTLTAIAAALRSAPANPSLGGEPCLVMSDV